MERPWKRPGPPPELQKRVRREEGADGTSAAALVLSFSTATTPRQSPPASMSSAHFNRGPAYGLSAEVKNKLAQKYDHQREQELREWIEGVTGRRIGNNFMDGLKDGIILCEFINKLQPGSVKKINESTQNWHQLENIGNFIKAITKYGVKPHDIFEANDLFENTNHTQVQSTLLALASMAKTKGNKVNVGVKYAEKQERKFEPEKLREGRNIIGLQMGTNKFASQQGMTAYGTRRHLYDPKLGTDQPLDQATISLQMGTNKGASQAGMTAPGTKRQIFEPGLGMEHCDTLNVSLQMGSNKGASQRGMTVYGLPRQVYDPKYCLTPEYPELGEPAHNHHAHNYYNSA
ncbi:PREDICTED: calponin-1 isoform X2 [Colobus angolensis palliatus]|uniref:calponin-1 isoform X2 n=1 Tax=Colobus angolensis palliatus TaxID=336983 RepID=UPI0005F503B7|nr:PREDICTED: calponin-1 isoform X2 [Colobus angolensis palliatus]